MAIGTAEMADIILGWQGGYYSAPDGWERLGEGCFKVAYLGPDGVVYKVPKSSTYDDTVAINVDEANMFASLRSKGCAWAPECSLWHGKVVAMPEFTTLTNYIKDRGGDGYADEDYCCSECNPEGRPFQGTLTDQQYETYVDITETIKDAHSSNIGVDTETGQLYCIDAGTH